jgi:hypothetical protein
MGLYLCVFDEEEEVEGVEVGSYDDFARLRTLVHQSLERGEVGTRFPLLMLHSDCDGEWAAEDVSRLKKELTEIAEAFRQMAPISVESQWQREVRATLGLKQQSLYDCFIDIDGEPLLERMIALCRVAEDYNRPILFQ